MTDIWLAFHLEKEKDQSHYFLEQNLARPKFTKELVMKFNFIAGVAELVDALDSGSSILTDVRVQVSPSAHCAKNFKE